MAFKTDKQRKAVMAKLSEGRVKASVSPKIVYNPKLSKTKDTDRDGVPDKYDCEPRNPKRHYSISAIPDFQKRQEVLSNIHKELGRKGFKVEVTVKGNRINLSKIKIAEGHNIQKKIGEEGYKRTKALSWEDWVKVNNAVNDVLDKHKVSARVQSLGGKFDIRNKIEGRRSREDWQNLAGENVGSQVSPIAREDYILTPQQAKERGIELKKR